MFYDLRQYHSPKEINIHEHRAPTDESAKFLKELQEKAMSNIMDSFVLKNTKFDSEFAVVVSCADYKKIVYYKIVINGRPVEGKFDLPGSHLYDKEKVIKLVLENISTIFTEEIFNQNTNVYYEMMKEI